MSIKRISAIFVRQFFLFKRSYYRSFGLFYWPAIDLLLWGFLTLYLATVGGNQLSFVSVLLGAVILLNFLTRVHQGISISYLEDVWVRNLMNLFASPLTIREYTVGLMLVSLFQTTISMVFMVVFAWFLFSYNLFQFGFLLVPFVGILYLFGWTLGIFTTAVVLRLGPSAELLAWSIPALITPLAGVFYPVSALPSFLQPVARLLPISYVFEGMRSSIAQGAFDTQGFVTAFVLSIFLLAGTYWFLLNTYRRVLRKGTLTRFMSE